MIISDHTSCHVSTAVHQKFSHQSSVISVSIQPISNSAEVDEPLGKCAIGSISANAEEPTLLRGDPESYYCYGKLRNRLERRESRCHTCSEPELYVRVFLHAFRADLRDNAAIMLVNCTQHLRLTEIWIDTE